VAVDSRPADPQHLGARRHGVLAALVQLPGDGQLLRRHRGGTAAQAAPGPCRRQAGHRPLVDQVPLELGEGAEEVEDELAGRCGGVDALLEAAEADAAAVQFADGVDEVAERAAKAVELPP
jgi:hypothetical protein